MKWMWRVIETAWTVFGFLYLVALTAKGVEHGVEYFLWEYARPAVEKLETAHNKEHARMKMSG